MASNVDGSERQSSADVGLHQSTPKKIDDNTLNFTIVTNDMKHENYIRLITLKQIISKQLPKMPKDYIVRLVFDRKHKSLCICKGPVVIGGICYRPYYEQQFAEIAFCAITASEQVKGYGTRLMNHLKEHVKNEGITHFLTFADNYAIGYFKKQGFTKHLALKKDTWGGYIKEYDGGTLMECAILMEVDYLQFHQMIKKQRQFLVREASKRLKYKKVWPGLSNVENMQPWSIPGLAEGHWRQSTSKSSRDEARDSHSLFDELNHLLRTVRNSACAWPFLNPVDPAEVQDYYDVIKDPVDLSMIATRLSKGYYKSLNMMVADLMLMCANAKEYNGEDSTYYKMAKQMESLVQKTTQKS